MQKYSKYSIEDLTTDSGFINWVLHPNETSDKFWNGVIKKYPSQKKKIEEAAYLINSIKAKNPSVPQERIEIMWNNIRLKSSNQTRLKFHRYMRWAAVLVILLGSAAIVSQFIQTPDFEFAETDITQVDEAHIILADGSTKSIDKEESEIEIKSSGVVIINNDTLRTSQQAIKKEKLNHVVMPYGKQTSLQLPDGTTVFINAGSRFSFPSGFSKNRREVYLVGEAFFEVESNKQKPFIVHTPEIDITVTGTRFNVSAYSDDNFSQTVLVSGAVSVSKNKWLGRKLEITPGESALLDKESGVVTTSTVETSQYTSWIYGYIVCENNPVNEVMKKIERYYNCKIIIDTSITGISFSGKLDFKEDVVSVLESIAYASSLKIEITNNEIFIKK